MNKFSICFGLLLTVVMLQIASSCNAQPPRPSSPPADGPTPTATSLAPCCETVIPTDTPVATRTVMAPSWRGITPGQTTREQVIQAFGQPSIIQTHGDLESLNYYPQGLDSCISGQGRYRIVLRKGLVQLIMVDENEVAADLENLVRKFGRYETIIEYGGGYPDVYVFATRGVAALAAGEGYGGLFMTEYFAPMAPEQYRASWGQYHPDDRPFPVKFRGHPIDAGVIPGQSDREQVFQLYGEPDCETPFDDWGHPPGIDPLKYRPTVLVYRVPQGAIQQKELESELFVSFVLDDKNIVRLANMQDSLRPGYLLKDALAKYGEPQHLCRQTKGPWPEFPRVPTIYFYPEKGVSVLAEGYPAIRPDDRVTGEWFYPPMSWDEYWPSWGVKPSVGFLGPEDTSWCTLQEWSGFPDTK